MLDKQDQIICALDKTRNEVVGELKEVKDAFGEHKMSLDERLGCMESDISRIKAKIGM
jgi:hypothetical protein